MSNDEEDQCLTCGGPLEPLGVLGRRIYTRCRDCGLDQSKAAPSIQETWSTHQKDELQKIAKFTLMVQNAVNLSGVVRDFATVITQLRALLPKLGTDEINTHPVCVLWADKIASLTHTQNLGSDVVGDAYVLVKEMAG